MMAPHVQVIQIHSSSAPPSISPRRRCSARNAARPSRKRLSSPGSGSSGEGITKGNVKPVGNIRQGIRFDTVGRHSSRWGTSGCTRQDMSLGNWLQEHLFERRIVLVTGRLDDDSAARAAAALLTLDARGTGPSSSIWTAPAAHFGRPSSCPTTSTTSTKRTRKRAVGTVKKSRATKSRTWLARNVRHV